MVKIKIIAGVYGHRNGQRVEAVRAGDPPIEVEDGIAERLIKAGVAEVVEVKPAEQPQVIDDEDDGEEFPEYSERMTRAKLEAIAREVGIDDVEIKDAETKADLIALIDEAKADYEAGGDAPTFDPEGDML